MAKRKRSTQPFWRFLLVVYSLTMFWLLFCRSNQWAEDVPYLQIIRQNVNLQPFYTIKNYFYVLLHGSNGALVRHCFINLAGNVLLFIPAGYLLPRVWRKQRKFFVFLFTCTGLILLVETVQLLTLLGSFDIDDVILNLSGMLLGYLLLIISRPK